MATSHWKYCVLSPVQLIGALYRSQQGFLRIISLALETEMANPCVPLNFTFGPFSETLYAIRTCMMAVAYAWQSAISKCSSFRNGADMFMVYIASKLNLCACCCFSIRSAFFSMRCRTKTMIRLTSTTPQSARPVWSILREGVIKSLFCHKLGSVIGLGMTNICELGMICVHWWPLSRPGIRTSSDSTKFGDNPIPNRMYGNCNAPWLVW